MKRFYFLLCCFVVCVSTNARNADNKDIRWFEFEVGAGVTSGTKCGFDKVVPGIQFLMEGRVNLPDSPIDLALQLSVGQTTRKDDCNTYVARHVGSVSIFADWNFRLWKNIAPFVGFGVGASPFLAYDYPLYDAMKPEPESVEAMTSAWVLNPRIGVEFINHFRLSFEYKAFLGTRNTMNNYFALNLGWAFGGGLRKNSSRYK